MIKNEKGISLVVLIFIVLLIIAISGGVIFLLINNSNDNSETDNSLEENKITVNNNNNQSSSNIENLKTLKVPGKEIYIDFNDDLYRVSEQSRTTIIYNNNESLIGFTFNKSDVYNGNLDDVVNFLNDKFMNNISGYSFGYLKESKITVLSSTKTSINNFESIKFLGKVTNELLDEKWECHVYGYTFIIDNVPCAVIGLVSAKAQDADMIAEINARVDQMASTIRTTK